MSPTLPVARCPVCHYEMDSATCLNDEQRKKPKSGDVSLCLKCGEVLVFTPELTLRQAGVEDMLDLAKDPEANALLLKAQSIIRKERFVK